MPKYKLEVNFKEDVNDEQYISTEVLVFKRENDKDAISYAFSAASIDARKDDKKLFRIIEPQGSTMRIYKE